MITVTGTSINSTVPFGDGLIYEFQWISTGGTTVQVNEIQVPSMYIWKLYTAPVSVSELYDVHLQDISEYDYLEGLGGSRSITAAEVEFPPDSTSTYTSIVDQTEATLRLKITGQAQDDSGVVRIYFKHPMEALNHEPR